MVSPNVGSAGVHAPTTRECLVQLSKLVPKSEASISKLTDPQREVLKGKIADLLQKVFSNDKSFAFKQRDNLKNIRDLAKKAEQMHLLSEPSKKAIKGIAAKTKEIGLSLYTAPLDCTIKASDGQVKVNFDVLKENSDVVKNMFEDIHENDKMIPVDLTKKTVKFLMECLHAPAAKPIELPNDIAMVADLIRFAAGYGFDTLIQKLVPAVTHFLNQQSDTIVKNGQSWLDVFSTVKGSDPDSVTVADLIRCGAGYAGFVGYAGYGFDIIHKLEPAVTQFLNQHSDTVVKNGQSWLDVLSRVKYSHPEIGTKWFNAITPLFLENFGIPVNPPELPGLFEIPIERLDAFFAEETRDLLKQLPLVLDIKDEKDLDRFLETIQTTKLESPLPIKLLCRMDLSPDDEKGLHQLAKASNIELGIEKIFSPPGTVVFGKELWDRYLGQVDYVPLPAGIGTLLASPCPAFPGYTWKDKFMLVLLPKTVKGEPLTLNRFNALAQHPEGGGHVANFYYTYDPILAEHGNKAVERSEWVLMSMDVIEGSIDLPYEEQEALVAAIPGCEVPDLLSAHVGILTHFIHMGKWLYGRGTRCKETIEGLPTFVVGRSEGGLLVRHGPIAGPPHYDVGALLRFK